MVSKGIPLLLTKQNRQLLVDSLLLPAFKQVMSCLQGEYSVADLSTLFESFNVKLNGKSYALVKDVLDLFVEKFCVSKLLNDDLMHGIVGTMRLSVPFYKVLSHLISIDFKAGMDCDKLVQFLLNQMLLPNKFIKLKDKQQFVTLKVMTDIITFKMSLESTQDLHCAFCQVFASLVNIDYDQPSLTFTRIQSILYCLIQLEKVEKNLFNARLETLKLESKLRFVLWACGIAGEV